MLFASVLFVYAVHSRHFSLSKMCHVHTAVYLQTADLSSFIYLSFIVFKVHDVVLIELYRSSNIFSFIIMFPYNARPDWLK